MAKTRFHMYMYELHDKEFSVAKNCTDTDFFDPDKFLSKFFRLRSRQLLHEKKYYLFHYFVQIS